tara:strand:+ start:528 stop:686 length:159 start_codon:yes stop_codon:yes gene_type:complete
MKFEYNENGNNLILYDNLVKKTNNSSKNNSQNFEKVTKNKDVKVAKKKKIII